MASPHELSGGVPKSPYEQDLWVRNQRIAETIGRRRAEEFRAGVLKLIKHEGLINIDALEAAAATEASQASKTALAEREAGLMNDEKSKQPGIFVTGSMDYEGSASMEEQLRLDHVPYTLDVLDRNYPFAPYALHLPEGAFECVIEEGLLDQYHLRLFGAVQFETDGNDFKPIGGGAHFLAGGYLPGGQRAHGTITRIEGAGGTLWQNPKVNADGTPRQEATAA